MDITGIKTSAKLSWHLKSLRGLVKRINDKYTLTEIGRSVIEKDEELSNLLREFYPKRSYFKKRFKVPLNSLLILAIAVGGHILVNVILALSKNLAEYPMPVFMSVGMLCGIFYGYLGTKHLHIEFDQLFWGALVMGVLLSGLYFYLVFLQPCLVTFYSLIVSRILALNETESKVFQFRTNHLKVLLILLTISILLAKVLLPQTLRLPQYNNYSHFNGYYLLVISEEHIRILTDFYRTAGIISESWIQVDVASIIFFLFLGYVMGLLIYLFQPKIIAYETIIGIIAILITCTTFLLIILIPFGSLRKIIIPLLFVVWPTLIGIWIQTFIVERGITKQHLNTYSQEGKNVRNCNLVIKNISFHPKG